VESPWGRGLGSSYDTHTEICSSEGGKGLSYTHGMVHAADDTSRRERREESDRLRRELCALGGEQRTPFLGGRILGQDCRLTAVVPRGQEAQRAAGLNAEPLAKPYRGL
jgi:hypothetical protein